MLRLKGDANRNSPAAGGFHLEHCMQSVRMMTEVTDCAARTAAAPAHAVEINLRRAAATARRRERPRGQRDRGCSTGQKSGDDDAGVEHPGT
eukprot:11008666-Lingulodinium_polyedra.AAC.1